MQRYWKRFGLVILIAALVFIGIPLFVGEFHLTALLGLFVLFMSAVIWFV